jgi:hypothetical protein
MQSSYGRRWHRLAPFLLAVLMAAQLLTYLDKWLFSNEVFNNLSMGLVYSTDDETLGLLRQEAIKYCEEFTRGTQLKLCRSYQNLIADSLYYAQPLGATLGSHTRSLLHDPDWLSSLHWIAVGQPLIGGTIAIALWLFLTLRLPAESRFPFVLLMFIWMTTAQSNDRAATPFPDAIREAGSWLAPLFIAAAAAVGWASAKARLEALDVWVRRVAGPNGVTRVLGVSVAIYLLALALPEELNLPLALAACAMLVGLLLVLRGNGPLPPVVLASVIGLLAISITSANYWFMRRLGFAASLATLIYIALIAVVTVRPFTRLAWIMPVMAVLHLPISGMVGLATFLCECLLTIRRRRASPLLYASALTAAIGITASRLLIESALLSTASANIAEALRFIVSWPALIPALASIGLAGAFCLVLLRGTEERSLALARGGLLILQGLGAALLAAAIREQDPGLLLTPGYAIVAMPAHYMVPALFCAGSLALLLSFQASASVLDQPGSRRWGIPASLAVTAALLLLMATAKVDLKLRNIYGPAPINFVHYIVQGKHHPQWCHFETARMDDDVYYLSRTRPTNSPIIYFSALKARMRVDRGVANPDALVVEPAIHRDDCHENPRKPDSDDE